MTSQAQSEVHLPRIAIKFCTQCKWNLRAAYFAQELLQTFSTSLGEVALIPVTGGIFTVTMYHRITASSNVAVTEVLLWDRKAEGGFPETKELKNRVRNIIEPDRDLGHIDRSLKKGKGQDQPLGEGTLEMTRDVSPATMPVASANTKPTLKEDCKDCP